jgi:hypothetical protein
MEDCNKTGKTPIKSRLLVGVQIFSFVGVNVPQALSFKYRLDSPPTGYKNPHQNRASVGRFVSARANFHVTNITVIVDSKKKAYLYP